MRAIKTLVLALAAGLAVACTVGPEYRRPDVDTGHGWSVPAADEAGSAADLEHWWQTFADATLDRLVTTALAENLDVREAGARVAEVRALRDAAAGGRYPAVGASAGITRRRQSENGPIPITRIPGIERDQTIYELGFDAGWEIDVFGGTRRAVEAANARLAAAVDQRHGVQLAIVAEIARSYFELRGARHELDALRSAIAATTMSVELVRRQRALGDVPDAAVAQAEAELAAIQSQLPLLEAQARAAALSIGLLLGDLPEKELGLLDDDPDYLALKPVPVGERADLLRRRPDVSAAERSLAAATADVGVATAELFPKIKIGANGGFQALSSGELFDSASQTLGLAPLISWRIFDGGRVRAQIHASEARVQIAALEYEQVVKEALTDAERALTLYSAGLNALTAARRSYAFANDRYKAGDISLLELLDAERTLRMAEETYARTHTQAATNLAALYKALGGGWQAADGSG
jgi:NodT family efflux transporter outer membrane factor (OMF) lipoprotein